MIPISTPLIGDQEIQAVVDVLKSGQIVQGKLTAALEEKFAQLCNSRYAIAASSGTTAAHMALLAHGVGPGDEVITTPFTFIATASTILHAGAKPVFVDIDADTFNIDAAKIEQAITPRTKAIVPVHLFGQAAELDQIVTVAKKHKLIVIEDACQAVGAQYKSRPVGAFGTGIFSLYATKNITSVEGGMITTNDADFARRCRLLRNHGMEVRNQFEMTGYNFRLTDVHAAIGLVQFGRLGEFTEKRRRNAQYFNHALTTVKIPRARPECFHAYHHYTVRVQGKTTRDTAQNALADAGIGYGVFYPQALHQYPHMQKIVGTLKLPVAEQAAGEVLSIPVHPGVREDDLVKIASILNSLP